MTSEIVWPPVDRNGARVPFFTESDLPEDTRPRDRIVRLCIHNDILLEFVLRAISKRPVPIIPGLPLDAEYVRHAYGISGLFVEFRHASFPETVVGEVPPQVAVAWEIFDGK